MSKIEAGISLFIITFFASIQYIFLAGVPENLSHFAFLCVTNLAGFLITLAFFFGELFRLDFNQVKQSMILSAELVFFNIFMLIGVRGTDPAVTSAVLSLYFVFIMIFESLMYNTKPEKMSVISVALIIPGLLMMMNADITGLMKVNILYLLGADMFFALYVITVGNYASSSNPSILAMGQMFFCFIFSLILWSAESFITGISISLSTSREFWVSVIYISLFIRGFYGIIQIYAQRYISPLNTSLIFSSEIVMTMLMSPVISSIFHTEPEKITILKIFGSVFILFGLVIIAPGAEKFIERIIKQIFNHKNFSFKNRSVQKLSIYEKANLIFISCFVYLLMDIPVKMTGMLPFYADIKSSLPFIFGLFFGLYGISGLCIGCVISSVFMEASLSSALMEIRCLITAGLCMFYGWHLFSDSHRIQFTNLRSYAVYLFLTFLSSILCFNFEYSVSYFICGLIIGLPTNILFGSLLYVEPLTPFFCTSNDDAVFELERGAENLEKVNEILNDTALEKGLNLKRVFEIQSCLEELSLRIFNAVPDTKIKVRIIYSNAVSMRLDYRGSRYNPFRIGKGEDYMDIMSLKIIKHRALRASFAHRAGKNKIHVVI